MSVREEDRLRELLDSLAPEGPPAAADAGPVVRRGRRRRRVTGATLGAAAVVSAAIVVPLWLNRPGADGVATAVDRPGADPVTALPCDNLPPLAPAGASGRGPGFAPGSVRAARLCVDESATDLGFAFPAPPADALVTGLDGWADALAALPVADPGRCAAVDVMPSPVRLLVERTDGSRVLVDPNFCSNVLVGDVTVDGGDVATSFLAALATQRASLPVPGPGASSGAVDCGAVATMVVPVARLGTPVAGSLCPAGGTGPGQRLSESSEPTLSAVAAAVEGASRGVVDLDCPSPADPSVQLVTIDGHGDVLRWDSVCGLEVWESAGRAPEQTWRIFPAQGPGSGG